MINAAPDLRADAPVSLAAASDDCAPPPPAVCGGDGGSDLAMLVHRAGFGLRVVVDRIARAHGLNDYRDALVLTVLTDDAQRSQLEIAQIVGIDKSTLTALLDRLERLGLVFRSPSPADRRVRIPQTTAEGRRVWETVARTRDEIEAALLEDLSPTQLETVREVLGRLADAATRASALTPA